MKADQERVSKLLTDTVTLLCKNGLIYCHDIKVQGLLGITLDSKEVFIVQINETVGSSIHTQGSGDTARKKSSSSSSSVVDLTRVADTPQLPIPQQHMPAMSMMPHNMMPVSGPRKQRHLHSQMMMSPGMQPHTTGRPMYSPRMRMNSPMQQQAVNNQFAASYMARLQQQVAMAPPPMRMMSAPRQRGMAKRQRVPAATVSAAAVNDDDEDVVIIGTGHEEPTPNWSSPARRQSSGVSSDGRPRSRSQNSSRSPRGSSQSANAVLHDVEDDRSQSDMEVTGTLELSAEDIPQSVEQLVLQATSGIMTGPGKGDRVSTVVIQPDKESTVDTKRSDSDAADSDSDVDSRAKTNGRARNRRIKSVDTDDNDGEVDAGSKSKKTLTVKTSDSMETLDVPVVYRDNAESNTEMIGTVHASVADIEMPGFDVLAADDASGTDAVRTWPCRFSGCSLSFISADQLAEHYQSDHAESLDLVSSSPVLPGDTELDNAGCEQEIFDCPVPDCGTRLLSRAGLLAHQRSLHSLSDVESDSCNSTPNKRKRPADQPLCDSRSKVAAGVSKQERVSPVGSPATFVCPVNDCGEQFVSRDDVCEHMRNAHQSSNSLEGHAPANVENTELCHLPCKEEIDN